MERFASLVNIFKALTPYRKLVMRENKDYGIPMARPLFMHFEVDPVCYTLEHQYLFGRDILVTPVIDQGETKKKLYVPAGKWIQFFTEQEFEGPEWVTVPAPLGRPTAFYRQNATEEFVELFEEISKIELKILNQNQSKY